MHRKTSKHILRLIPYLTVLSIFVQVPAYGDDWPQWLGPNREGIWRESGIIRKFGEESPNVRWRTAIGSGYAGPAIAKSRVYVTDRIAQSGNPATEQKDHYARRRGPGLERVLCLNETDGSILWKHEYDCPYTVAYPAGPRATPTVHQGKVYTLGAEGNLFCFDAAKGDVLWSCDFKKAYSLKVPVWGVSAPPLIDGNKLICIVGGKGTTAVAFDKDTGKEIWRALSSKSPGYSAPIIYKIGSKRQLIIWHGESINSLDPQTGKLYWSIPIETWSGMAIATPRLLDDSLFIMGFRYRSTMIRMDTSKPAAKIVWQGGKDSGIAGAINTPFLQDGYIYGSGHDGNYRCVELKTGKRIWETYTPTTRVRKNRWANAFTIKNGDRFFLANDEGDLIIAKLTPDGYKEIDRTHIIDTTGKAEGRDLVWSHPAFANKSVYARNDKEIVCISLAETQSAPK